MAESTILSTMWCNSKWCL